MLTIPQPALIHLPPHHPEIIARAIFSSFFAGHLPALQGPEIAQQRRRFESQATIDYE